VSGFSVDASTDFARAFHEILLLGSWLLRLLFSTSFGSEDCSRINILIFKSRFEIF
jgi:hypothetical protein